MKPIALAAAGLLISAFAASSATAQSVEISDAVARVVVIVEDRQDIAVEIEPGRAELPELKVRRNGQKILIDGGLRRDVRRCRSGPAYARQSGEGASVDLRARGQVALADAPLILIRSPLSVDVSSEAGAVFGAVGPGATATAIGNGGCGDWVVANTSGQMRLAVGGSGRIRAGSSSSLRASVGGSGDILAGPTGTLDASVGGSGDITVVRVDGAVQLAVGGSGDIVVRDGSATSLSAAIAGSGDIDFRGTADKVDAAIAGSGDIRVARATGRVDRAVVGSGDIRIGQ